MFDLFSLSLELPPIFRFHSAWFLGDLYSVFQGNYIILQICAWKGTFLSRTRILH